jgi:hypothetical protein
MGCATIVLAFVGSAPSDAAMVRSDILNAPTVIVTTSPFHIDRSFTDPLSGSYHVIIDDPTMEMKAKVVAAACAPPCAIESASLADSIDDTLHFKGLAAAGQPIRFHLIVDGTGFIPSSIPGFGPTDITEQLIANLNMTGTPVVGVDNASINTNYQNFGASVPPLRFEEPADTPFDIFWDLTATRTEFNGVDQPFDANMRLLPSEGAQFDFLDTAQLVIDLPHGVSVTSDGGFSATGAGIVPEPSTWAMLLLGFAGLGFSGWAWGRTVEGVLRV